VIDASRVYSPPQIVTETGASRAMVYDAITSGDLPSVARGRRHISSGAAVLRWLDTLGAREGGERLGRALENDEGPARSTGPSMNHSRGR
jgi:hypothetical protein